MSPTRITGATAQEIADSVRTLVSAGDLAPGDVVPSIRDLADALGVHRNTVAMAYRTLVGAGLAETHGRRGTLIRAVPRFDDESPAPGLVDLSSGNPDPELLPDLTSALGRLDYRPRFYGSPTVDPGLAEWARRTWAGEVPDALDIAVTHGGVDAVDRLLSAHLARGDRVALEDPCFYASEGTVRLNGMHAVPVGLDAEGMRPDALRGALRAGVRAVVATPRAHNPTGVSTTARRAGELRDVLAAHPHVLVVEDDHFSLVSRRPYHRITPPTTLHWALVRSVAKFLGPDVRVAVVASDPTTATLLGTRLRPGATWVSHVLQQLVTTLLTDPGTLERLSAARDTYARRTDSVREALGAAGVATPFPTDGLNVWIPTPSQPGPIVAALRDAGWSVRDGSSFRAAPTGGPHGIRATVSRVTPAEAAAFAGAVAAALRPHG